MPGRRVGQLAGIGIERHAQRGRHRVARDVTAHAAQHLGGRAVVVGVGAEGVAHLPHQDGRGEAAAGDVSDGDLHGAVVAVNDVVPVAADLETCAARPRSDPAAPRRRSAAGAARAGCAGGSWRRRARARSCGRGSAPARSRRHTTRHAPDRARPRRARRGRAGRARPTGASRARARALRRGIGTRRRARRAPPAASTRIRVSLSTANANPDS